MWAYVGAWTVIHCVKATPIDRQLVISFNTNVPVDLEPVYPRFYGTVRPRTEPPPSIIGSKAFGAEGTEGQRLPAALTHVVRSSFQGANSSTTTSSFS